MFIDGVSINSVDVRKFISNVNKHLNEINDYVLKVQNNALKEIAASYRSKEGYDFQFKLIDILNNNLKQIYNLYYSLMVDYKKAAITAAGGVNTSIGNEINQINVSNPGMRRLKNYGIKNNGGKSQINSNGIRLGIQRIYMFIGDIQKNIYEVEYLIKNHGVAGVNGTGTVDMMLMEYVKYLKEKNNYLQTSVTVLLKSQSKLLDMNDEMIDGIVAKYSCVYKNYSEFANSKVSSVTYNTTGFMSISSLGGYGRRY